MSSVLEEKDAIRDLLASYCFHIDGGEYDKFVALFTEDAIFDIGPLGKAHGREAIRKLIGNAGPSKFKHCTINSIIRVNGNEAHAESYLFVLNGGEHAISTSVAGRYEDQLVKQGDQWRFKVRKVHLDIAPAPR